MTVPLNVNETQRAAAEWQAVNPGAGARAMRSGLAALVASADPDSRRDAEGMAGGSTRDRRHEPLGQPSIQGGDAMSSELEREAALRRALYRSSHHGVGVAHWRSQERARITAKIAEAAHLSGHDDRPTKETP